MNAPLQTHRISGNDLLGLQTAVPAAKMLDNMRSAVARGLPQITPCKPHARRLSIAGGGPSLADTYPDLGQVIATINGSLRFLLDRPDMNRGAHYLCGVCDAGEHIADMLVAHPSVRYYIASACDPTVFDKLLRAGCDVRLWHVSPDSIRDHAQDVVDILDAAYAGHWHTIGGGCTMGLRWINLGHFLGFRCFDLHGLDSSFRNGATHAYPDRADTTDHFEFKGRWTRPNFIAQVQDFFNVMDLMAMTDPGLEFKIFGDGLLQDECKPFISTDAGTFTAFRWPPGMREGMREADAAASLMGARRLCEAIQPHLAARGLAVQANGGAGAMARFLSEHFGAVHAFEPDADNYECVVANTDASKVTAHLAALDACRLDDLQLPGCDLIVLDMGGNESEALRGAQATINRHRPVIVVSTLGGAMDWLVDSCDYGYAAAEGVHCIMVPQ